MGMMRTLRRDAERRARKGNQGGLTGRKGGRAIGRAPLREPRLIIENLEPRFLLSGEGIILPPPPSQQEQQAPIQMPAAQVANQFVQPAINIAPDLAAFGGKTAEKQVNEIVFVDAAVEDKQSLINAALQARPGQNDPAQVEVVVLDGARDGVEQIAAWLKGYEGLQAVHVISHGDAAALRLGLTTLDPTNIDAYRDQIASWGASLSADGDILLYGCDVAAGAQGESFVQKLALYSGADVAASVDRTGAAALGGNWVLEAHTGVIDVASLSDAQYNGLLALDATTLQLNAALRTQLLSVLDKIDVTASEALKDVLVNTDLPGLGKSVNELIGLDSNSGSTTTIAFFGLKTAANSYFTTNGNASTLTGLASALQTAINTQVAAAKTVSGDATQPWTVAVTPSFDPTAAEVVAGLKIKIDLNDWTKSALVFSNITDAGTSLTLVASGTLTSVANLHFDFDAGLTVAGVTGATNAATALTGASATDNGSWFRVNKLELDTHLTGTTFDQRAGISVSLLDANNSDRLGRITLNDFAALSGSTLAAKAASALDVTQIASLFGTDGSDHVITGKLSTGALAANVFDDVTLSATDKTNLASAFAIATATLSRLDSTDANGNIAISALGRTLPLADVSTLGLLALNDGRTFSDVLGFRTPQNTTVLADYLAATTLVAGTPKVSGLLDYMRQYLSGTGVYSGLEAMMSASAAASAMNVVATGATGNFALNFSLKLDRRFIARFTFNDNLSDVGINWLPGEGIKLKQDLQFDTVWTASSSASVDVNTLTVQVQSDGHQLDAGVVLGALEARAVGTLVFDTGAIALSVNGASPVTSGAAASASLSITGTPSVTAAADFDIVGKIGTTGFEALVSRVTTDTTTGELVITTLPAVSGAVIDTKGTKATGDDTVTLYGNATFADGEQLYVSLDGNLHLVVSRSGSTYTPTAGATYDSASASWTFETGRSDAQLVAAMIVTTGASATVSNLPVISTVTAGTGTRVFGTTTTQTGNSLVVTVDSIAYTIVDTAGNAVNGTAGGNDYISSYAGGNWSVTLVGVSSVTSTAAAWTNAVSATVSGSASRSYLTVTGTAALVASQSLIVTVAGTDYTVVNTTGSAVVNGSGYIGAYSGGAWSITLDNVSAGSLPVTARWSDGTVVTTAVVRSVNTSGGGGNKVLAGTATLTAGQALEVTVTNLLLPTTYVVRSAAGTLSSGASYDASTGLWSLTLASANLPSTGSVAAMVVGNRSTPVAMATLYPPTYASTGTVPTVLAETTGDTTPTIFGTTTLSTGETLTVSLYSGTGTEGGTALATYTLGDGNLSYDSTTHRWTLTVPTALGAGTYSVKAAVKQVPHVEAIVGAGSTSLDPNGVLLSSVTDAAAVTLSDFDNLRKFASIDSATLNGMLTDVGNYLVRLRDSGQFDAVLPYTDLTLGKTIDFSAIVNQVTDEQLVGVLTSGIAGSNAVSPVLTKDVSFDLIFSRPGDARNSLVTVTVLASETASFTHIDQLAALIDLKLATGYGGLLAWTQGDGTVPGTAVAEVSETIKGGSSYGNGTSNEAQNILLHASSGTFTLGFGSAVTGPISVFATAAQVQNALETLSTVGRGNVVVVGTPKHYSIEFVHDLAGQDLAPLSVAFQNATHGGALDVVASNLLVSLLPVDLDQDRRVGRHVDVRGLLFGHQPKHAFHVAAAHVWLLCWGRAQARSRSLMLVLARVCASTFLTITAQYRLYLPPALGRLPLTTTDPAGMRP